MNIFPVLLRRSKHLNKTVSSIYQQFSTVVGAKSAFKFESEAIEAVTRSNKKDTSILQIKDTENISETSSEKVDTSILQTKDIENISETSSNKEDTSILQIKDTENISETSSEKVDTSILQTKDIENISETSSNKEDTSIFQIKDIENISETSSLRVTWSDKKECEYPHIFLRDNCQCPSCFHPTSKQRLLQTVDHVDLNIKAKEIGQRGNDVIVTWPDGHKSIFEGDWLRKRMFPDAKATSVLPSTLYGLTAVPWYPEDVLEKINIVSYDEVMTSDEALLTFYENIFIYGLSLIKEAPTESGVLHLLSKRISHRYLKQTHYGNHFTVKNKPSPNNLAYTAGHLPLHVDLPFYSYQPEVQFLHCIEQSAGENSGTSLLRDGLQAAKVLQENDPQAFDLLTKVKFKFDDFGKDIYGDFNFQFERPIIGLDGFGQVKSISYNNHVRSSFINVPSGMVKDSYRAYFALSKLLNSNVLHYKLSPGEILCFNNTRVLHGRTEFDPRTTSRWLEGCYMDFDELQSIYRVVKEKMLANQQC